MRHTADEASTFAAAITILMHVEEQLGISIEDATVESIRPWSELTLQDLILASQRSMPSGQVPPLRDALRAAVRTEYPEAPLALDFAAPLLDAISPRRYEGS